MKSILGGRITVAYLVLDKKDSHLMKKLLEHRNSKPHTLKKRNTVVIQVVTTTITAIAVHHTVTGIEISRRAKAELRSSPLKMLTLLTRWMLQDYLVDLSIMMGPSMHALHREIRIIKWRLYWLSQQMVQTTP